MDDDPTAEAETAALLADMARLGMRKYSEVGVPMFLVAENLRDIPAPPLTIPQGWPDIAAQFDRHADLLTAERPEVELRDVARLIEVLADRHIVAGTAPRFTALTDEGEPR